MHKTACLVICVILSWSLYSQHSTEPIVIGQRLTLDSEILQEERPILISLPKHYDRDTLASYGVIYLLDGDGHFHHTSGIADFLRKNDKMPPMIVVGIPNTSDRTRDLTPHTSADTMRFPTAGGADRLLNFIQQELFAYLAANYRTNHYKLLIGHSFGGLFAAPVLLHHPGVFNSYLAISPSLWWDQQDLVKNQFADLMTQLQELAGHYYMSLGNEGRDMLGGVWKMAALLEEQGPKHLKWKFEHLPDETHGTIPLRSTVNGLEFIFQDWSLPYHREDFELAGIEAIDRYEEQVDLLYGLRIEWEENQLQDLGQRLLDQGKAQKALPIFDKAVHLFPNSASLYFGVGAAQAGTGQESEATESLTKVLAMEPDNFQAIALLKQLGEDVSSLLPDVKLQTRVLESYAGAYEVGGPARILTITLEKDQLWAEADILPKEALVPLSDDTFYLISKDSKLVFEKGEDKVSKVLVKTPEMEFSGIRK